MERNPNPKQILMLTLGHNSSALLYDLTDNSVIGYEQERLTRIKGDSQFPSDALLEIVKHKQIARDKCVAYVSHWFPTGNAACIDNNKYFTVENENLLRSFASTVVFCDDHFSHHDAHAYSAMAFRNYFSKYPNNGQLQMFDDTDDVFTIVADGFGNNREVLSIYKGKELVERKTGYCYSLGLMYQYATSFVGMKENQDEYKFLGYESHVHNWVDASRIDDEISYLVKMFITDGDQEQVTKNLQREIDSLTNTKTFWHNKFGTILSYYDFNDLPEEHATFARRCVIGYLVQSVVETVILHYLLKYKMVNVNVAGGLFYNVKLNNLILTHITGTFCPMPLAGDQGAAIGMAYYYNPSIRESGFNFGNLCFGKRSFYNVEKAIAKYPRVHYLEEASDEDIDFIAQLLADGNIVNVVGPDMEFGPRALCMTSTLFLPTAENTAANNHMNGRNEVMPCAPVCTERNANIMFNESELNRVIGSDAFMICTHTYNEHRVHHTALNSGAMHVKPDNDTEYTGRPQIICKRFSFMDRLLTRVQTLTSIDPLFLVNTSFNVHGQPIVFDLHAILQNYSYQCEHAYDHKIPYLFIFNSLDQ